jgi:L-fuculose-phosphate aldolase
MTVTESKPTQLKAMVMTKPYAPPLPDLTPHQELALLARCLFSEGYDDHLAGHITYKQPDGTFLVNPFGLTWDEIRASDVMRMDADGHEVEGRWTITPAITLHVELHKAREDVTVAVHNHSRWGTIWADLGRVPEIYDQTSAFYDGEVALYDEYWGAVDDAGNAQAAVQAVGAANIGLLANHGVLVLGKDIEQAYLWAMGFEWLPPGLARGRRRWGQADEPRRGRELRQLLQRPHVHRPVRVDGPARAAPRPVDPRLSTGRRAGGWRA